MEFDPELYVLFLARSKWQALLAHLPLPQEILLCLNFYKGEFGDYPQTLPNPD